MKGDACHGDVLSMGLVQSPTNYANVDDILKIKPLRFDERKFDIENKYAEIIEEYWKTEENKPAAADADTVAPPPLDLFREDNLHILLLTCFSKYNNCVITIDLYTYAILSEQQDEQTIYHFFDSHSYSAQEQKSSLKSFRTLEDLIGYILQRYFRQNFVQKFEVCPLELNEITTTSNTEQSNTVDLIVNDNRSPPIKREIASTSNQTKEKNNEADIIDLDNYPLDRLNIQIRSPAQIEQDMMNKIKDEIMNNKHLTDHTINHIGKMINDCTHGKRFELKLQNTLELSNNLNRIQPVSGRDDVQFLFQDPANKNDPKAIGHWICINYVYQSNELDVYDSLNSKYLPPENLKTIEKLYPTCPTIRYRTLLYTQTNDRSCGVFASANAISLALQYQPYQLNYKISKRAGTDESAFLRKHLLEIINSKKLSPFPVALFT